MEDHKIIEKINIAFANDDGKVTTFSTENSVPLGKFLRAHHKNRSMIIFEFSEASVGLFIPLSIISIVKNETKDGFEGGEICKELFIDGDNFWNIVGKILNANNK